MLTLKLPTRISEYSSISSVYTIGAGAVAEVGVIKFKKKFRIGLLNFEELYIKFLEYRYKIDSNEYIKRANREKIKLIQIKDRISFEEAHMFSFNMITFRMRQIFINVSIENNAKVLQNESINGYNVYVFDTEEDAKMALANIKTILVTRELIKSK